MASRGGYGGGGTAGGKVRRRPAPRAAAASPYARRVASTVLAARDGEGSSGEGSGWITRLITGGASRLLSSVFRKPPPQLAAPPLPASFDAPPTRPESLDAPPSPPPPPPPLEDAILEGEENDGHTANNLYTDNPENLVKDGDGTLISSEELEELLKQMTFTRSEFEYLVGLLQSRTVGYNTLQAEVSNIKQTRSSQKENGSRGLPVDFSIRSYSVADQVASPAEIAKAYMGSICLEGSPLRLRLHDPSTLPNKSVEASTIAKSPNPPLLRSSRLSASTPFDRLGSNCMTPNKSAIHKMSLSPYFKGPVPSRDMSGTLSSSYQTSNGVRTFGRQILKRKSIALNNETVSVGPIRKMRQRYNRVSPFLERRPGYRGYLGSHASKLDEDSEHSTQIQKRQCLAKVDNDTRGACGNTFGQAPPQSTEMAAKILKQLDTLVPSQKEGTSEIKQRHQNAIDVDDCNSQSKEILFQGSVLKSTSALNQEYSVINNVNVAAKFTPAAIDGKSVDAISERSTVLESKSSSELVTSPKDSLEVDNCSRSMVALHQSNDTIEKTQPAIQEHIAKSSGTTNKENPPTSSLQSHSTSNLVLSSEIDRSMMSASSNGFSFPVTAALGAHSQAPPTPTMASPPTLPVGKDKSAGPSVPVTSAEGAPWISKRVSEEGSVSYKHVKKLNGEIPPISSKSAGHVASFTSNPVFNVTNSKPTTLSNGLAHTPKSTVSAVLPSNGPNNSVFSTNAGSSTSSLPQFSFQPGFQTSSTSTQQSGGIRFKAAPNTTLQFSMQSNSTGGSFTFSNTGPSSSLTSSIISAGTTSESAGAPPSGSSNAPFNFSPKFGGASFLAAQDKSETGSGSTPLNFSAQFGSLSSVASLDKSKVTSSESAMLSGNQCAQSGNSNLRSTQSSASKSNLMSSEKSNMASFANSQFGSAPSCSSPFSSIVSSTAASGSTSVNATPLSLPATSSALGSSKAFSASPIFGSNLITTASPFGILNAGSAILPFSSTSSAVFSFTSSTPTVPTSSPSTPNPSPSTPLFGSMSPTIGSSRGTDQMNGVHIAGESNQSPFFPTPPFGFQRNSPSTPVFSTPATQFASTTSTTSPGIFQFGQPSQASAGGFSMGSVRDNDKSGRRILKVKRKK